MPMPGHLSSPNVSATPLLDAFRPDASAQEAFQQGLALAQDLDWPGAAAAFDHAAARNPDDPTCWFALANARFHMGRYHDSIQSYLAGLQRRPDFAPAHIQLGNAFQSLSLHEEARQCFETALALGADRAKLLSAMAHQAQQTCTWDSFAQDFSDLRDALVRGARNAVPFQVVTAPSTRQEQRAAAQAYWEGLCRAISPLPPPPPRNPGAPIRIGYVTNDIYRHATAHLIAEVFECHDRDRFDIHLYSYGPDDGSEIRRRIVDSVGRGFRDIRRMPDQRVAERIRADEIDVLLDLKGYTFDPRPGIFAAHPARIQVNYLGYPGTLGSPCHEYIIGDAIVTPIEHADGYSECIAQLPACYQPNDRKRPVGVRPSRKACGLPEHGFVFCSFNRCYKITDAMFDRWCRLLREVDGSVLWLYEANPQARKNLSAAAQRRGVSPERLVWAPNLPMDAHLGRLQLADLMLDTFPVTAHTTASDALWAGLPLITTLGESFVSRVAASTLRAAGLPDLVAPDVDSYERLAFELATNPARLREIRDRLGANRAHCALFDTDRYVRDLETLFLRMISRWDQAKAPCHLESES